MSNSPSIQFIDIVKIRLYWGAMAILYILYFVVFFGVFYVNPDHIRLLSTIVHLVVAVFLLWNFNPLRKYELRPYDNNIIFASAVFLFTNVVATEIGLESIKHKFMRTLEIDSIRV